jgi:hypothetical protein
MQIYISTCPPGIEGIDMTDTTRRSHAQALAKLREARGDLLRARLAALDAQLWLVSARVSGGGGEQCADVRVKRAAELCDLVTDAVAHAERLLFFVEGDSATHRTYAYLRDEWQAGDTAPTNGSSAMCVRGSDITGP